MVDAGQRQDFAARLFGMNDADGVGFQAQTGAWRLHIQGVEEFSHAMSRAAGRRTSRRDGWVSR
jgi:hypothetical protein